MPVNPLEPMSMQHVPHASKPMHQQVDTYIKLTLSLPATMNQEDIGLFIRDTFLPAIPLENLASSPNSADTLDIISVVEEKDIYHDPDVIVFVEGGIVQSACSNNDKVNLHVIDDDENFEDDIIYDDEDRARIKSLRYLAKSYKPVY